MLTKLDCIRFMISRLKSRKSRDLEGSNLEISISKNPQISNSLIGRYLVWYLRKHDTLELLPGVDERMRAGDDEGRHN
jgi:hypothetical protein